MFRVQSCLLLLMLATGALDGEETNAPVRALGDGRFAVGLVTLDKNGRSISFPATVNLREETIEYVVVHKTGKAHESIFRTDTRPQDIHQRAAGDDKLVRHRRQSAAEGRQSVD
jgi:hypothetical protein